MKELIQKLHITPVTINPAIFPVAGFMLGVLIWIIDAMVDVYILGEEQSLLENILTPEESTEMWMRALVVIVFVIMGYFFRRVLLKHLELDEMLLDYQNKLEKTVAERTEALVEKTRELEKLASVDPLSGLYNRRKFSEVLDYELKRFYRYKKTFSLINIDIDFFKKINDSYGHDVGDKVIKGFCDVLKSNIRSLDSAGRWGGEEFILLIVESNNDIAVNISEKINNVLTNTKFEPVEKVTVSIGVTQVVDGDTNESIIIRSDKALYKAKNNGRNRIEIL